METQYILDTENDTQNIEIELKKKNKSYITIILILIVINITLFSIFIKGYPSTYDAFKTALIANLIGYNIVGFILGTIVALFSYKKLGYRKKYLRASLLSILTIQIILTLCLVFTAVTALLGINQ